MGLFGDKSLKETMDAAAEITADNVVSLPAPRLDTVVVDPVSGGQRHRTDYAGTTWYGGRPQLTGGHPIPGRDAQIAAPFWLPDSHRYDPAAAGDVQVQASAAVQGANTTSSGGSLHILGVDAALGEDPGASDALLVYVTVTAISTLPLGVAYRVTVICAPEALRSAG